MPELAEVETVRKQIEKRLKGRKILEVIVDEDDRYLYAFAKAADVVKALTGAKIKGTGRKGKYFWIKLDRKPWPIFHLGMSGNIAILDPKAKGGHEKVWGGAKLWSERERDHRDRLNFARMVIEFNRGFELAFIDPRRFGRMWLSDDPENHARIAALGDDPLLKFPTAKQLGERLKRRKMAIKSVLLDQSLFAGVGNWLADEILYQARISPHRLASELSDAQLKILRAKTVGVVKAAVKVDADYERFPKNWLFHDRWGRVENSKTHKGQKIKHETIGGRTAAWVPGWQK